jgi:hypothetical protein
MQEEVNVRVDEAGEQSGVAQIDDLGSRRTLNGRADFGDVVSLDTDLAGSESPAGIDFDQPGGVEHDRTRSLGGKQR